MTPTPIATYRVQLHQQFDLDATAEVVDYLAAIGISHCYCSPVFQAVAGSMHGYDVVDPTTINTELGDAAAHDRFRAALERYGLHYILDIVPNHMATEPNANLWWRDLLAHGAASACAPAFDLAWHDGGPPRRTGMVLPVLARPFDDELEDGALRVVWEGGEFAVAYGDHTFPLAWSTMVPRLAAVAGRFPEAAYLAVAARQVEIALGSPDLSAGDAADLARSDAVIGELVRQLAAPPAQPAIDGLVSEINGDREQLAAVLDAQVYRLAWWRVAGERLDYRRFFDINGLVGIRVDDDAVFDRTHGLIFALLQSRALSGLRVDHPDGLRDPARYCQLLAQSAPDTAIYVEKILARGERLPADWPVAGTTGYDFMNLVGGLFVDHDGEEALDRIYAAYVGDNRPWSAIEYASKLHVLDHVLAADLNRLAAMLRRICDRRRRYRDCSDRDLRSAVRAVSASLPVYRTYLRAEAGRITAADRDLIAHAVERAAAECPEIEPRAIELVRDILQLRLTGDLERELVMRFQQLTGPVAAKGIEDTAFYRYLRLIALNEVGGDPGVFGVTVDAFHAWCEATQARWPGTLLATATHDHKRGEDTRLRIALLSEAPAEWLAAVEAWSARSFHHWPAGGRDRAVEYLLFQTLVGAWPITVERATNYMQKAIREAKLRTSWTTPDSEYEQAVHAYVTRLLSDEAFVQSLEAFVEPLIVPARISGLSQTVLKLTAPGVPDIFQGRELWDHSLVDPDNRTAVDYRLRRALLAEAGQLTAEQAWARHASGLPKLLTIVRTLAVRREHPAAFGPHGAYACAAIVGAHARHLIGFTRGDTVAIVAPRLTLRLPEDWADTTVQLTPGDWMNAFTGQRLTCVAGHGLAVRDVFDGFPVALLTRAP